MLNAVIVVDDEASIRTAVEQWLSLSGFDVQLFSRAEECLAQLPAVLDAVGQYWHAKPATEAELEAMVQRHAAPATGGEEPPRHRGGHWVH